MAPMSMIRSFLILFALTVNIEFSDAQKSTVSFSSEDNVTITADIYMTSDKDAPFILLFHQAGYSRGEYIEIAPRLNNLGFNCIAIDQRSGNEVNGVINETHIDAVSKGMKTKYPDAYSDLEAALKYVKGHYSPTKLLVWGSSYSSSLVFILAAKHKNIDAILSFSPGEYFIFEGKGIGEWAKQVSCPIFVTSSQNEAEKCSLIFKNATHKSNIQFIPSISGFHGSKALWEEKAGHEEYWKAVKEFLEIISLN